MQFATAAQVGTLFSGVMQGAIMDNLDGHAGLEGWQWLFVLDFIITVPIAAYGFLMFPDTPHTVKACTSYVHMTSKRQADHPVWLTEEERALCISRLPEKEHVKLTLPVLRKSMGKILFNWRWYLFSALFAIGAAAFEKTGIWSEFIFYLKSTGTYTASEINYYPSIFVTVAIVSTYGLTVMSDRTGNRFIINPIMYLAVFISSVMLLKWDISDGAHWFAYIIAGFGYAGQASNFAWANTLCRDDEILRAVTLASMNMFSNIWVLWYAIVCWPVVDAPKFRNGQIGTLVTGFFGVLIAVAIVYCSRKYPPDVPALQEHAMTTAETADKPYDHSVEAEGESVKGVESSIAVQRV